MKLPFPHAIALLASLLSWITPVRAADDAKISEDPSRNQWVFNIDFPGGSIDQLVKSISTAGGGTFNVVGEKADLATEIPAFSLRNADGESLANALSQLVVPRGLNIIRAPGPNFGPKGPTNFPIYVLVKRNAIDRPMTKSFQVGPYLDKQSVDDIVVAIRTLWELNPGNRPEALQIKYHPPTKLLLVSGTPEAIMAAAEVISNLAIPPKPSPKESSPTKP